MYIHSMDENMLNYCTALTESISESCHVYQPVEYVFVKTFKQINYLQPHWEGLFQVLLMIHTAAKLQGKASWIHGYIAPNAWGVKTLQVHLIRNHVQSSPGKIRCRR